MKEGISPIQKIWKEPIWTWAFRLAISVCVPLVVGLWLGQLDKMFWVALAAQAVAFMEMKGSYANALRVLISAILLATLASVVGSISGNNIVFHIALMFVVGFICTLFKNLGERGVGMSLSIYIFYIVTSANPIHDVQELWERTEYVFIGASWSVLVALLWMMLEKQGRPARKTISDVFHQMSILTNKARSGFGGEGLFIPIRELYLQENKVRQSLNLSIELFDLDDQEVHKREQVGQLRKIAGLLNIQLLEIIEHCQVLKSFRKEGRADLHIHSLLRVWEQIFDLSDHYIYSLKIEDKILLETRLDRLEGLTQSILSEQVGVTVVDEELRGILKLSNRMSRLIRRLVDLVQDGGEKRIYQTYSFSTTMKILHPKMFSNEFANLFKFERNVTTFALRVGVAVTIGIILDYLFFDRYGYWIPFTSIIVAQPYIGATIKKGVERTVGTLLGIIFGYIFFEIAHAQYWNIILLFISSIFSIYFIKTKYSIASFFITLSLLSLLSISDMHDENVLWIRLWCTVIGSAISIGLGFLFISTWDVSMFPNHFKKAIRSNYEYFLSSPFIKDSFSQWMKYKRIAESSNVQLYESYTRWIQEPKLSKDKKEISRFFTKIAHVIRITKEINNVNLEWEMTNDSLLKIHSYDIQKIEKVFVEILNVVDDQNVEFDNESILENVTESQKLYLDKLHLELSTLRQSLISGSLFNKTNIAENKIAKP